MAEVFVAKKGSLSQPSKTALRKAGIVVVEIDDLEHGRFWRSSEIIDGSAMLVAALRALSDHPGYSGEAAKAFLADVLRLEEARLNG